jgi:hypothetical protein
VYDAEPLPRKGSSIRASDNRRYARLDQHLDH